MRLSEACINPWREISLFPIFVLTINSLNSLSDFTYINNIYVLYPTRRWIRINLSELNVRLEQIRRFTRMMLYKTLGKKRSKLVKTLKPCQPMLSSALEKVLNSRLALPGVVNHRTCATSRHEVATRISNSKAQTKVIR